MRTIAIAEYESDFSDAIVYSLANEVDVRIVKTVNSGKKLLSYIAEQEVDIVLMDHRMPDINGLEATRLIKKAYPDIKVLILSFHINEKDVNDALDCGADGYLSKNISKSELMDAVRLLSTDQSYFSEKVHQMYLQARVMQEAKSSIRLTPRETEILPMIGNGLTSVHIANSLCLGVTTINTHRKNLLKKFIANNNAELVKKAVLSGYIS